MTRREIISRTQKILTDHRIPDARIEAEVLLCFVLGIDRTALYTYPEETVNTEDEAALQRLIERRIKGEPTAYITGCREFCGLVFEVNPSVLIPRPETELLVEKTIDAARGYASPLIADIGTGSGAVAVTLALNLPQAKIYAVDVSGEALEVARRNSVKHRVESRITFLQANLLQALPEPVNIIAANLPYVTTEDLKSVNTTGFEPELALHGGTDGLHLVKELILSAPSRLLQGGCLLLEIGLGQKEPLASFLEKNNVPATSVYYKDLGGIARVVSLRFS